MAALADPDPLVQGRAAEGLGLIGHKPAADAIADMMQAHVEGRRARRTLRPMISSIRKPPPVEAVQIGMYALVRLARTISSLACCSTATGSRSAAGGRSPTRSDASADPQAGHSAAYAARRATGVITRAFAARGLGVIKERRAVAPLCGVAGQRRGVRRGSRSKPPVRSPTLARPKAPMR